MTVLVWAAERQELSDELVRVGDAVISFSLRQDLLPSIRDSGHLYCRVNTAPHRTKTKLLKALSHCKKKESHTNHFKTILPPPKSGCSSQRGKFGTEKKKSEPFHRCKKIYHTYFNY